MSSETNTTQAAEPTPAPQPDLAFGPNVSIVNPLPPPNFPQPPVPPVIRWVGHGGLRPNPIDMIAGLEINGKYSDLGGESGFLGRALGPMTGDNGYHVDYAGGSIYWSLMSGVHEIHGEVYTKWISLGGALKFGFPSTDTTTTPDGMGYFNRFHKDNLPANAIYWYLGTGAHSIVGPILLKWDQLGGVVGYGYPMEDDSKTPDGVGRVSKFQKQDGSILDIYWSPSSGAHSIYGEIKQKWQSLGSEAGYGYPTTDETVTSDGTGRFNQFAGGRAIYFSPTTGAHAISGDIKTKWDSMGAEAGYGYPLTDEAPVFHSGRGRFSEFSGGRSIYWTATTGAHAIFGVIREKWYSLGAGRSFLGYPTTDENGSGDKGGRYNDFESGTIYFSPATGAHEGPPVPNRLEYRRDHHFDNGVAANGSTSVVLNSDGSVEFHGHMHDSGAIGYDYVVGYGLLDADKQGYAFTHKGSIAGSLTLGSPEDDWSETAVAQTVATNWRAICASPQMHINAHIAADVGTLVGELFGYAVIVGVVAIIGGAAGGKQIPAEEGGGRRWEWD